MKCLDRVGAHRPKKVKRWLLLGILLVCAGTVSPHLTAQAPSSSVPLGQIVGDDVSVTGPANPVANTAAPTIEFSSGDTIVVHAGKARIEFTGGGQLDICGPAKFTVLSTEQAITVALSFGRVHAQFDALRPIAIYTPLLIATPLSVGERPRDATVGLSNTGAMCALATRGAVRLQNQLSGETVIVPQPSEVFVPSTSFANLPAATGECRCDFDEPIARQTAPPAPAIVGSPGNAVAANNSTPPNSLNESTPVPSVSARTPIPENKPIPRPQPASPSPLPATPQVPAVIPPSMLKPDLPRIGYEASGDVSATEPLSVATLMLAQETVVEPDWLFQGRVEDKVTGSAGTATSSDTSAQKSTSQPTPKKRGFWAKFHDFLFGSH